MPIKAIPTRTIRTSAFWWYPPPPHDYPYYWVILDPKWKEDKVKVTNLKNSPKFPFSKFWYKHYTPHFRKLLDMICKYEMDQTCIVEDTERTRFCPQMDRRTDRQGETSIPPFNFVEAEGITKLTLTVSGNRRFTVSLVFISKRVFWFRDCCNLWPRARNYDTTQLITLMYTIY